ncbi:helix-turn-helix domain-containing protein [Kiloniella laminariae]|uniref:helix-turn-helix domain-containing protein n=1 Tax=Kiloniella laminariae TaxID=454162 RepID=UPI0003812843|nr:RodZ domain-containing protein [Kiloniella laminariae]
MEDLRENIPETDGSGLGQSRVTVAEILRTGREKRGQDLRGVANVLRIRYVFLEAIERGDFASLPGDTYAYGFVRTYAGYLNLNEDEIVRQFKQEVEHYGNRQKLVFPTPVPESKIPGFALILTSAVLLAAAYGGWVALSRYEAGLPEWVPFVSGHSDSSLLVEGSGTGAEATTNSVNTSGTAGSNVVSSADPAETMTSPENPEVAAVPSGADESVTQPNDETPETNPSAGGTDPESLLDETTENASEVSPAAEVEPVIPPTTSSENNAGAVISNNSVPSASSVPAVEGSGVPSETVTSEPAVSAVTTPPAVSPPSPPEPQVFGDEGVLSPISIRAERDTWMHIVDGKGEVVFSQVLRAGDEYKVPQRDGLVMATGNAGGIIFSLNGKDLPLLGAPGVVRRDVPLSVDGLQKVLRGE